MRDKSRNLMFNRYNYLKMTRQFIEPIAKYNGYKLPFMCNTRINDSFKRWQPHYIRFNENDNVKK